jgi:hypothetical protein
MAGIWEMLRAPATAGRRAAQRRVISSRHARLSLERASSLRTATIANSPLENSCTKASKRSKCSLRLPTNELMV